jgi:sugar O-acyltransferase (sialic acid O-acetyltransferase NeuD family)
VPDRWPQLLWYLPCTVTSELTIFGAWYLADVIEELAVEMGWNIAGRIDPDPPDGVPTLQAIPDGSCCFVAVGDNALRRLISQRLIDADRTLVTLCHPSAVVSTSASIGPGTYVGENVVIRSRAILGDGVLLNAGAVVSHHCNVGQFSTLGPNAALAGRSSVGDLSLVGIGANVLPNRSVGDQAVVGAGAVVNRDVPDDCTVVGNPAIAKMTTASPTENQSDWHTSTVW